MSTGVDLENFTVVLCIRGQIPKKKAPRGAYIRRSDLTEGFLCYNFGGLIFGGAYTWRGLFSEFYGIFQRPVWGYKAVSYLSLDFFLSVHRYSSYN